MTTKTSLNFQLLGKDWPHRQNLSSRGKLVVQTALKMKCWNAAAQKYTVQCWICSILHHSQDVFFTQRRGVRQGCSLILTLFNMYINELAVELDQCAAAGLSLLDREVKSLFYADDLILLSSTEQGPQQQLDIVEKFCQNWALAITMKKTNIMIFQKRPRCQENKHQFTINLHVIEHSMSNTYLGMTITASGSFNMAVMH